MISDVWRSLGRLAFRVVFNLALFTAIANNAYAGNPWIIDLSAGNPGMCTKVFMGGSPAAVTQAKEDCYNAFDNSQNLGFKKTGVVDLCSIDPAPGPTRGGLASCQVHTIFSYPDGSTYVGTEFIDNTVTTCPWGAVYEASSNKCIGFGDIYYGVPDDQVCLPCIFGASVPHGNPGMGDPIYPLTGSRRQDVPLGFSIGDVPVKLTYDTVKQVPEASGGLTWLVPPSPAFGSLWQSNLNKSLYLQSTAGSPYSTVALQRGSARQESASVQGFNSCTGAGGGGGTGTPYVSAVNPNEALNFSGSGSASTLVDGSRLTEEAYNASGLVISEAKAGGAALTYSYASGLLASVTDQFGRSVQFGYQPAPADNSSTALVNLITAPDGSQIHLTYDSAYNLKTIAWADGKVQTFEYENNQFNWALTGIVDENSSRYSTYGYDSQGRASSTSLGSGVDNYSVTYSTAPAWSVKEYPISSSFICREHRWQPPTGTQVALPTGQVKNVQAATANGMVAETGEDRVAGSGSSASTSLSTYDANGNIASYDDFDGYRSCFAYDLTRNLPTIAIQGLAGGASGKACPSNLASYVPSPDDATHPERKVTTVWHPDWVLKAREAEPKKLTTWVYNGQADPIAGGTASCAPSTATLPDGKPIAVLCARYEQATSDATGALGLSAAVVGATRAWRYTYNQYGQALTETTPKQSPTDTLSHTTTYAYYGDTSLSGGAGHTIGDLQTITNPLGQVTSYTSYDAAGRLLSSTDANGVVTSQTYWPRGWLKSRTVTPPGSAGSQTTNYDYWPTGLLKTVTMPDASTLSYAYDNAHRLTDVTDGAGNTVHYVLDNSGNRTSEQLSDASGNLASTVTRVFDALNRVQSQTGMLH